MVFTLHCCDLVTSLNQRSVEGGVGLFHFPTPTSFFFFFGFFFFFLTKTCLLNDGV